MTRSTQEEIIRQLKINNALANPGATLIWFLFKLSFLMVGIFVIGCLLIKH